jgi:hypothetical protein
VNSRRLSNFAHNIQANWVKHIRLQTLQGERKILKMNNIEKWTKPLGAEGNGKEGFNVIDLYV